MLSWVVRIAWPAAFDPETSFLGGHAIVEATDTIVPGQIQKCTCHELNRLLKSAGFNSDVYVCRLKHLESSCGFVVCSLSAVRVNRSLLFQFAGRFEGAIRKYGQ